MTIALCLSCSSKKFGAMLPCEKCGSPALGNLAIDMLFTDHHFTEKTIEEFGEVLRIISENSPGQDVAIWAFLEHITRRHPHLIMTNTPSAIRSTTKKILASLDLPEVIIEDSMQNDQTLTGDVTERIRSRTKHTTSTCPACNHTQSFAMWPCMFADSDTWLRQSIQDLSIFQSKCNRCGICQYIPYETVYHSVIRNSHLLSVWLRPENADCPTLCREDTDEICYHAEANAVLRIVSTAHELIEKIRIFNDGFDDVFIESIKIFACIQRGYDILVPLVYKGTTRGLIRGREISFSLPQAGFDEVLSFPIGRNEATIQNACDSMRRAANCEEMQWRNVTRETILAQMEETGLLNRLEV